MSTITATPDPTTGSVLLDVEQTQARDLFTRVVANGWGNATTGQAWGTAGGVAADYNVNGTQGTHTLPTAGVTHRTFVTPQAGINDQVFFTQVIVPVTPLTQPIEVSAMARYTDASNQYFVTLSISTANVVTMRLVKAVLGVLTTLDSRVIDPVHVPGTAWNMGISVCGTLVQAKAWVSTVVEPNWMMSVNDFDLTTGAAVGVRTSRVTGNTNVNPVIAFDNAFAYISQPVRVYRQTPNAVRTEVRGSPLNTFQSSAAANTGIATLWDNEAPLDTQVTYVLTSYCTPAVVVATSAAITLLSNGDGWLRDPQNPTNNIRISFASVAYENCSPTPRVSLLTWEPRAYRSASGQFDILNNPRPNTVSMKRKRYDSAMTFASRTLEDVDDIETTLADGVILLLSLPARYGFGRPYNSDYITIGDVAAEQIVTDDYGDTSRLWEIPFALSPAPPDINEGGTGSNGIGGGGATYADMTASAIGVTYATTTATGLTYQQLAQGVGY